MTSKSTSSQGRQCHARHRSGLKERAKGREARGNDFVRGWGWGLMLGGVTNMKKQTFSHYPLQKLSKALTYLVK